VHIAIVLESYQISATIFTKTGYLTIQMISKWLY